MVVKEEEEVVVVVGMKECLRCAPCSTGEHGDVNVPLKCCRVQDEHDAGGECAASV